ncbi:MAG: NADH-quinone oxidoreductase subunit L, partial [bacterium]|nr:NADH-quinone oxidoreductase subunit L [bacterium]
ASSATNNCLISEHTESLTCAYQQSWFHAADLELFWGILIDPLTLVMLGLVTFVALMVQVYSLGYMHGDPKFGWYFAVHSLFAAAMLTLVLADNFLLLYVAWELVGICSYLLIGFWYTRQRAADAGKKAFIVNRIGDVGFILAMLLLFVTFQTSDFLQVQTQLQLNHAEISGGVLTAIALLLFMGAVGKSAQLPLYVWLPDAMEGPTPVSALIHAATMVTAGVYMMARSAVLFTVAPAAGGIVALIGILTALFAASMALVAMDIKRVLAYSTISQLGYMVFAVGIGAYTAGIFHLVTHAFFKALLFLGAGSVIHALHEEQDMRKMGNLRRLLPTTHWTMLVATLAIAGIFPFAGFWSKDEILAGAIKTGGINILWWLVALCTAFLTSFYMFRLLYLTFYGTSRVEPEVVAHVHEAPAAMRIPLMLLGILSIVGGLVLGFPPESGLLHRLLAPVFEPAVQLAGVHHAFGFWPDVPLMLISLALALAGWWWARSLYASGLPTPDPLAQRLSGFYTLLVNNYYVDEAYHSVIIRPIYKFSDTIFWGFVDVKIIDRMVNMTGDFIRLLSSGMSLLQTGHARTYAWWMMIGALVVLWSYS